jgi:hypothetical protein
MPDEEEIMAEERKRSPGGPASLAGSMWFAGWLFTIGYAELVWWKAVLGVIVWPYFLGVAVR